MLNLIFLTSTLTLTHLILKRARKCWVKRRVRWDDPTKYRPHRTFKIPQQILINTGKFPYLMNIHVTQTAKINDALSSARKHLMVVTLPLYAKWLQGDICLFSLQPEVFPAESRLTFYPRHRHFSEAVNPRHISTCGDTDFVPSTGKRLQFFLQFCKQAMDKKLLLAETKKLSILQNNLKNYST